MQISANHDHALARATKLTIGACATPIPRAIGIPLASTRANQSNQTNKLLSAACCAPSRVDRAVWAGGRASEHAHNCCAHSEAGCRVRTFTLSCLSSSLAHWLAGRLRLECSRRLFCDAHLPAVVPIEGCAGAVVNDSYLVSQLGQICVLLFFQSSTVSSSSSK